MDNNANDALLAIEEEFLAAYRQGGSAAERAAEEYWNRAGEDIPPPQLGHWLNKAERIQTAPQPPPFYDGDYGDLVTDLQDSISYACEFDSPADAAICIAYRRAADDGDRSLLEEFDGLRRKALAAAERFFANPPAEHAEAIERLIGMNQELGTALRAA